MQTNNQKVLQIVGDWFTVSEMINIEKGEMRLPSNYMKMFEGKIQLFYAVLEDLFISTGKKWTTSSLTRLLVSKCLDNWRQTNGKRLY